MAVSRMAVALRIDDEQFASGDRKSSRKRTKQLILQLNQDVMIMSDFLNSLHREIHSSGVNYQNVDEVLTFIENKRLRFAHILEEIDENDKKARFNLSNLINFLRRIQERSEDFMKVIAKVPGE